MAQEQKKDIRVRVGDQVKEFPAGTSDAEIETWVASIRAAPSPVPFKEGERPSNVTASTPVEREELFPRGTTKGFVQRAKTPISIGAGLAGTGLAAATGFGAPGAGLVGSGVSGITDSIIEKYLYGKVKQPITEAFGYNNEPSTSPTINTITGAVQNALINEITGRLFQVPLKALGNVAKEVKSPGVLSGRVSELEPTLSQYYGEKHPFLGTIENIFARKAKGKALENSANLAMDAIEAQSQKFTGKSVPLTIFDEPAKQSLDDIAKTMRLKVDLNNDEAIKELINVDTALQGVKPTDPLFQQLRDYKNLLITEVSSAFNSTPAMRKLIQKDPRGAFKYYAGEIADQISNNPEEMQRFFNTGSITVNGQTITSVSAKKELQGYKFMRIIQDAYDSEAGLLDISALKNNWDRYKVSEAGRKLYSANNRSDLDALFDKIAAVSHVSGEKGASKYLTLKLGTGVAALGSGLIGGMLGGKTTGMATAGTIVGFATGLHVVGKLMTNPSTARLMYAAASGGPLNMPNAVASRILARAMRGEEVTAQTSDGKEIKGKINPLGKFVPYEQ